MRDRLKEVILNDLPPVLVMGISCIVSTLIVANISNVANISIDLSALAAVVLISILLFTNIVFGTINRINYILGRNKNG